MIRFDVNFRLVPKLRKGKILTAAHFGCLQNIPTINITNGCLFRCVYCYARGYSQTPKTPEVHLYINLPYLLSEEIKRKRVFPKWVILNTSSDCFQFHPEILQIAYQTIEILLNHGIGISFLTKGVIPQRFFELFKKFPEMILPQIGIVSLSDHYWKRYEPGTPSPEERLKNIEHFREIGIIPEVRIDPIIPFFTDTEIEIKRLFENLNKAGIKRVTLSYLHLRPAIERQLMEELSPIHLKLIESCFKTQEWRVVGTSTRTKLIPKSIREKGYKRIIEKAKEYNITAIICKCKNPDMKGDICSAGRLRNIFFRQSNSQLPLFRC